MHQWANKLSSPPKKVFTELETTIVIVIDICTYVHWVKNNPVQNCPFLTFSAFFLSIYLSLSKQKWLWNFWIKYILLHTLLVAEIHNAQQLFVIGPRIFEPYNINLLSLLHFKWKKKPVLVQFRYLWIILNFTIEIYRANYTNFFRLI